MFFELFVLNVIQGHPCLYDKSDVGFGNNTAREISYNTIKDELKKKYYTIPDLFTTEFLDKFINEILMKAPNKDDAIKLANEKFGDVRESFETDLENVMAEYPNLWDKSNPDYNNNDVRKDSFKEIAKTLTKNHDFLKTFINEDSEKYKAQLEAHISRKRKCCQLSCLIFIESCMYKQNLHTEP